MTLIETAHRLKELSAKLPHGEWVQRGHSIDVKNSHRFSIRAFGVVEDTDAACQFIVLSHNSVARLCDALIEAEATTRRLGSGQGFCAIGRFPDDMWGEEIKARMDHAHEWLKKYGGEA